jgi:hypothetical protein
MATFKTKRRILKVDESVAVRLRKLGLEEIGKGEETEKEKRVRLFAEIAKLDVTQPYKNAKTEDLEAILEANK